MKKNIFIFLLLFSFKAFCQKKEAVVKDENYRVIDTNIFRINLIQIGGISADEVGARLVFSYEHEIKKPFTIVLNAGPTLFYHFNSPTIDNPYRNQYSLNAFVSAEARYYVTLNKRIKRETKTIRNYTAMYFSLEPYIVSNPAVILNQKKENAYGGRTGVFLNVGWQRQFKHIYFNIYNGVHLFGTRFNDPFYQGIDWLHTGLTIGGVF